MPVRRVAAAPLLIVLLRLPDLAGQPEPLTAALSQEELVERGATWKYFRGLAEPAGGSLEWNEPGFDDSSWQVGDGEVNISDPVHLLLHLFAGGEAPSPEGARCFGEEPWLAW